MKRWPRALVIIGLVLLIGYGSWILLLDWLADVGRA